MQRQRGELVPIGEVVADLDGPVQAIRGATPHASLMLADLRSAMREDAKILFVYNRF